MVLDIGHSELERLFVDRVCLGHRDHAGCDAENL
jgi:hypothetical protein